jgi:Regulator of Vps4 activity in the MVB pathway
LQSKSKSAFRLQVGSTVKPQASVIMGPSGEQALFRKLKSNNPLKMLMLVQLKMSVNRLRLMQQKQTALAKQARRELAQLLDQGKEESARIRVENIIREDLFVEMLEILELYCELLLARFGLLEQMYTLDYN